MLNISYPTASTASYIIETASSGDATTLQTEGNGSVGCCSWPGWTRTPRQHWNTTFVTVFTTNNFFCSPGYWCEVFVVHQTANVLHHSPAPASLSTCPCMQAANWALTVFSASIPCSCRNSSTLRADSLHSSNHLRQCATKHKWKQIWTWDTIIFTHQLTVLCCVLYICFTKWNKISWNCVSCQLMNEAAESKVAAALKCC